MARLKLSSIVCETPEESDKDEIYLIFGGEKIWPLKHKFVKIDFDETLPIGLVMTVDNPGSLKVELWEYDLASKNDHLGTFHLDFKSLEPENFTELLIRDENEAQKASYFLNWEITK